ncbi:MAG: ABC transporter substrate-binding protein [Candidatus Staskawiczbacteria bacterium]|nr:ABC transporter substrate-binding protein [Candidatus Staskawiczbacteria bacterium]
MQKITKTIIFSLIVLTIIGLAIWFGVSRYTAPTTKEIIRIGAVLPLSGKNAEWGEWTKRGIELALEEANVSKKLNVFYEDSGEDVSRAVSAAQKLINIDKVEVLICQLSDVCSAVAPVAQSNKAVLFGFTNTPDFEKIGDYIFNFRGDARDAGKKLGEFASQKYKTAAVLYLNNATQKGVFEGFKKQFEQKGGQVVISESHIETEKDFRVSIGKIKEKNPQIILIATRPANFIDIVKQIKQIGLSQPLFGTLGVHGTKSIIDGLQELAEGIIYPAPVVDEQADNIILRAALERHKEKFNEPMPIWTAEAYDATKLLALLADGGAKDSDSIKNALVEVNGFLGLAGNIDFSSSRAVNKPYYLFTIKNGQFIPYEE